MFHVFVDLSLLLSAALEGTAWGIVPSAHNSTYAVSKNGFDYARHHKESAYYCAHIHKVLAPLLV